LITQKSVVYKTPWFSIIEKKTAAGDAYYALQTQDYLCVVAITKDDEFLLVRQFRPAIERLTLELPAGHVDEGESPEVGGKRELLEETGYRAGKFELLGAVPTDTGRFENDTWCFLAQDCTLDAGFKGEEGVEVLKFPRASVCEMMLEKKLDCALHYTALALVMAKYGSTFFGGK
jgi:ADP-ribose pyrophosphatase